MREGVTNKGGGYRAARRGHKQGRGVIALKKETDKHINEHLNAQQRGTERAGGNCAARGGHKQGRGVIALKKQTDKQINEHLKAQEWGQRKEVGVRAKSERHDEKRATAKRAKKKRRSVKTNERKASDRKMSVTKPIERESERTKSKRAQNGGRFERTWVLSEAVSSALESDQRPFRAHLSLIKETVEIFAAVNMS